MTADYANDEPLLAEFSIPVMFDVPAPSRAIAAQEVFDGLVRSQPTLGGGSLIESWWMVEGQDKHLDGNDRDDGHVVFGDPLGWLVSWPQHGTQTGYHFTADPASAARVRNRWAGAIVRKVYAGDAL